MKKYFLPAIVIITLALFGACKKSSTTPNYSMSANVYATFINRVDTIPFFASTDSDVYAVDSAGMCIISGNEHIITQYGSYQYASFYFLVKNYTGPGTYNINDTNVIAYYGCNSPSVTISGLHFNSGQLTINVSGETVSGTFSGAEFDTEISGGTYVAAGRDFDILC